jgi:hypothetical protein
MARLGRRVRITGNPSLATFREELPTNRELGLIQGFIWWELSRREGSPDAAATRVRRLPNFAESHSASLTMARYASLVRAVCVDAHVRICARTVC